MINTHHNGAVTTLMVAADAINPLSRLFQRELDAAIGALEARKSGLAGVVIGFSADATSSGHELEHLASLTAAQAADCMHTLGAYNALLRRIDTLGVPVVATLNGDVSGHALGLALACHRRLSRANATFSMPQVSLGLAPAAGEIARTVRLTGLQAAIPLLVEGAVWTAAAALQAGLINGVAASDEDMADQVRAMIDAAAPLAQQPWDAKGFRLPGGALNSAPLQTLLQVAPAMLREKTGGHYPAPEAVLCAMVEGLQVDFDNAQLIESRYFCQCAIGPVAKNLMRLNQLRKEAPISTEAATTLAATLNAAYDAEIAQLRAEGVAEALLRNGARAAGMARLPESLGDAGADAAALSLDEVRDRLLYAQVLAAQRSLGELTPAQRGQADLASVQAGGFPAYTGGVLHFVDHVGAEVFARRALALGTRFAISHQ